jgi:Branched-chain amino acid transport protein (AzlD)
MSSQWFAVIFGSLTVFGIKFAGAVLPDKWLSHPRILRINTLIPVALLSALVAVQSATTKTKLVIDHRLAGVAVALIALKLRAPFPVVVVGAALTSALIYRVSA